MSHSLIPSLSVLSGGWNNNPSCRQFEYIFRLSLTRYGVEAETTGNSVAHDTTIFLDVDQRTHTPQRVDQAEALLLDVDEENTRTAECDTPFLPVNGQGQEAMNTAKTRVDLFRDNTLVCIAGWVVRQAMPTIQCDRCRNALLLPADEDFPGVGNHLLEL